MKNIDLLTIRILNKQKMEGQSLIHTILGKVTKLRMD